MTDNILDKIFNAEMTDERTAHEWAMLKRIKTAIEQERQDLIDVIASHAFCRTMHEGNSTCLDQVLEYLLE